MTDGMTSKCHSGMATMHKLCILSKYSVLEYFLISVLSHLERSCLCEADRSGPMLCGCVVWSCTAAEMIPTFIQFALHMHS